MTNTLHTAANTNLPRVVVVGAGAMGGAVARGLVVSGLLPADHVAAADRNPVCLEPLSALSIATATNAAELMGSAPGEKLGAAGADVVILAVKPQVSAAVMAELADVVAGRLVVSIMGGVALATLEASLPASRVVRVMPNLPVTVLSGASAVAAGTSATPEDAELVRSLFASLGSAVVCSERELDIAGVVAGCAPAFFSLFADALARAGVAAGLPSAACRELVTTTMQGTAAQLLQDGVHPRAYMDRVTSPGGTTAAGLRAMEPFVMEAAFAAVDAALDKTAELAAAAQAAAQQARAKEIAS